MSIIINMNELKFTNILTKALEGKNLSRVAQDIGMDRNLLFQWAKSKRSPSLKNIHYIKKLADYLGLTLEELLIGEEEKKVISSISFSDEGREYRLIIERTK
jgi:transcriptional regulator with XRE-family HTH domain